MGSMAINPSAQGMVGSQALVALSEIRWNHESLHGTGYEVTKLSCQKRDLSFPVSDLTATYSRNAITIFATLRLDNVSSTVNQVWQEGPVSGGVPSVHPITGLMFNLWGV
ncbi:hypothetical protein RD792_007616 [Penstemon davidsonii]|uniref:AIR12 DOMON domain-containing protein n=1 Tax=Penstemon davidsonii TaxID=160366 RepID=A0ABR0D889_9LAMI|nr:hypothetical protein RD792_007616 [Penstemon davidsonii]